MESNNSIVLVVDDIKSNVEFIIDIISTIEHIDAYGVNDGGATLEFVKKQKPDLILLDISMPIIDGFEVCKRLKASPDTADIPIIFLTARVQKEDTIKGFEVGAVDYIAKPFNISELLSRVKTHLELGKKRKELVEINTLLEDKVQERTKQLVQSNENLAEAHARLEEAYEELSSLDHAKNDFIAHINHELRTPLNGILGYTSLLEEMNLNKEAREYLDSINVLVTRLIKVAEISLLLTELRAVDNRINLKKLVLNDIISNCVNKELAEEKNLKVIKKIENSHVVLGEPRLLNTCFSIIIDNALKYSPENSDILIESKENKKFISVEVVDKGPGFSSVALSRIFELFTADNLEYSEHGFGIGLATAKRIIDLLGGKINIKNNNEAGASVIVHLKKTTI
ncbi:MAG: hybrid sensor histidine kinase/response regulator [Bacteroidales bacterium]|nr:hybrid sensor histidine kinase/response regulator [Bacteroidales bacterium]